MSLPHLLVVVATAAGLVPAAPEPPADLAALIVKLRRNEGRTTATNALAARDDAAPYLRLELAATTDPLYKRDVTEALEALNDRTSRRNAARAAAWAADGRVDLLAELLSGCPEGEAAAVARQVNNASVRLARALDESHPPDPAGYIVRKNGFMPNFDFLARPTAGDEVSTPPGQSDRFFVRARKATAGNRQRNDWLVAAGAELQDADGLDWQHTEWWRSVVLVNGPVRCGRLNESLVVCDGDAELSGVQFYRSLVLANGSVTLLRTGSTSQSTVWAAGDVVLKDSDRIDRLSPGTFLAGGNVKLPKGVNAGEAARGGKPCPFGVRFVDPAEFGLGLVPQDGGVRLNAVEPWSPFAKCDVRAGDIITAVDGRPTTSATEFRRALRRGIVRESVVVQLRRSDQRLARVAYLDGVPTAPAKPKP